MPIESVSETKPIIETDRVIALGTIVPPGLFTMRFEIEYPEGIRRVRNAASEMTRKIKRLKR